VAAGVSRRVAAAGLAAAALAAAVVAGAIEPNLSQWPAGVGVPAVEADGTRTFSIDPGDQVRFLPGVARPGDVVVCEGKGVVTLGPRGTEVGDPVGVSASNDRQGSVLVTCEARM
jgi:hypothetical protein